MRIECVAAWCLSILTLAGGLTQSLSACERCQGRHRCQTCEQTNDRGLLDLLDDSARRARPQLTRWTAPGIRSFNATLQQAITGRPSCKARSRCGCPSAPACGCEITQPTCGCEMTQPGCGCEMTQPSCGCESTQPSCGCESSGQAHGSYSDWSSIQVEPGYVTPPMALPDGAPIELSRPEVLREQPRVAPLPFVPGEKKLNAPDNEVDPFRDDAAVRIRKIPARSVQYRQTSRSYGESFDPQARNEGAHMRLSDQSPTPADQLRLASDSSSRVRVTGSPSQRNWNNENNEVEQSHVVTAAAESQRRPAVGAVSNPLRKPEAASNR